MFGKLMKHELKATGRVALPLCGVMLALSVAAGFAVRRINGREVSGWLDMTSMITAILYCLSLFAVSVGVFVMLMIHFKRSMLGDEGYLTMTLPVSLHGLLLSRLLTALLWYLITGAAMALSVLIAGGIQFKSDFFKELSYALRFVFSRDDAFLHSVLIFLAVLLSLSMITLMFYADYSLVQSFRKHKVLYHIAAVVVLIALLRLCGWISVSFQASGSFAQRWVNVLSPVDLAELIVVNLLLSFAAWWALSRKLNLE